MARVRLVNPRWRLYGLRAKRALVALAVALLALDWLRKFDAVRHNPVAAGAASALVIAACALPVARVVGRSAARATLRRRFETGRCLRCGYPMTGNISGVCPECGRRFVP